MAEPFGSPWIALAIMIVLTNSVVVLVPCRFVVRVLQQSGVEMLRIVWE